MRVDHAISIVEEDGGRRSGPPAGKQRLTVMNSEPSVRHVGHPRAGSLVRPGKDVGGRLEKADRSLNSMAETPDDSSLVGRKIGRFRVVSKLGHGGIATVWKATDELLKRTVALKILDRSFQGSAKILKRFAHEPQSAARLQHPGIVTVFDA